jgi:hypothetical protein
MSLIHFKFQRLLLLKVFGQTKTLGTGVFNLRHNRVSITIKD